MAADKRLDLGLPGRCDAAQPRQGPTVTLARALLVLVLVVSGVLSGCNTKATKSAADAEGDVVEAAPQRVMPMGFVETFPRAFALSQLPLARDQLGIRCQQQLRDLYLSFVGIREGGIFVVALSRSEFGDPGKNLYEVAPREGLPESGTMDWGYVLDRNDDGKVDYLAFLDGLNPVVPNDRQRELPKLRGERGRLSDKELKEIVLPNLRLLFWHLADDNYDGHHDAVAASLRNLDTGWIDGWMVANDGDFDGLYDVCKFYQGQFQTELGSCDGDATGFSAPGRRPSGMTQIPPRRDLWILKVINEAAQMCGLSGADFRGQQQ
jgi:hypothetical protein